MMQDDDDNDDPMILNIRAKNHTSERTIVPWTVIFYPTTVQVLEVFFSFCVSLQLGARRSTRLLVVYILDYGDQVLMFIFTFVLETTLQ